MRIVNVAALVRAACGVWLMACLMYVPPSHAIEGGWGRCPSGVPAPSGAAPAQSPPSKAAKTVKLADNVYMFQSPWDTNTLIVIGKDGVLITDTYDDKHVRLLKQEIAKITDKPVTKIVLAHEHFDHIGGTRQFAGAEIIAQKNILPFLIFDPLHRGPAKIDTPFDTNYTIDMGTTKVELRYLGPSEGIANTVIYLPKEKMALLTDLHPGGKELVQFLGITDTNFLGMRHVLNEVSKWDLKYVLDSHTTYTDPQNMRVYAAFLNDLYDAVFPVVKQASETEDLAQLWYNTAFVWPDTIKLPKYKDWLYYDEEISSNVLWMASSILYNGL